MGGVLRVAGDGGYFDRFKTIGERFGPFDLTLIETGAYNEQWPDFHMQPSQAWWRFEQLR